jgi:hypothetical protein
VRMAMLTIKRNVTWLVGVACAPDTWRLVRMPVVTRKVLGRLSLMLVLLTAVGCTSVGPVMMPRDRIDYITAVAESWKEQTLLNIVRMRYGDAPTFVDVSSVVSAYAFQGQLSAGAAISSDLTSTIPRNLVTVLSRSMLEILLEVAAGIDVPGAHVSAGRTATATRLADAENMRDRPLIRILSGPTPPTSSFDAVHYRGTWYWIDDNDFGSKRIFTFLMLFFSLAETGATPQAPVLTIPVN